MRLTHLTTVAFATALAFSFSGCNMIEDDLCSSPSGDILTETVVVDEFTSINVVTIGTVYLQEGTEQEIRVEGEQEILDRMEFSVVNGELIIDLYTCFQGSYTFNLYITIPEGRALEGVSASGYADLETTMPIEVAENFTIDILGFGEVIFEAKNENESLSLDIEDGGTAEIQFMTNTMEVNNSSSREAEISGTTTTLDASISDAGELNAFELEADSATIIASGSGDAEVTITGDDLEVDISGSGSVYYKGMPSNIQSRISGAGELIDAN